MKNFPNGFESWQETHFEVVSYIEQLRSQAIIESNLINEIQETKGTGGFYELAEELTDEFEKLNEGREWDGEFFDEIEDFLGKKLLCQKNKLGIKVINVDNELDNRDNETNFIQHYKPNYGKERNDYSRIIGNAGDNRFIFFGIDLIKRYKYEK